MCSSQALPDNFVRLISFQLSTSLLILVGVAVCPSDFDENVTTFYKVLRDKAGYHTMVTGRDDLDKSSGGPGVDGMKHTDELGFSDSVRCDGSTDVTRSGVPHEPYGKSSCLRNSGP